MKKTVQVKLVKPARKKGGDRYESEDGFVIYVPQNISRENGSPFLMLAITFESFEG